MSSDHESIPASREPLLLTALIKAHRGDRLGNLVYRKAARNFGPIMASAAACTVAQVDALVEVGALDPEAIVTPGIFVRRVVAIA